MSKLIALASAIWIALAILIGFICLVVAIGATACTITYLVDKAIGWIRGKTNV